METILNPITSFFKTNMPVAQNWIKNALAFIQRSWVSSVDFVDTLPYWLGLTIRILFSFAVLGVLSAHFMGIVRAHKIWKKDPLNNLARGYLYGTAKERWKKVYSEAYSLIWSREWFLASFAGLAASLGKVTLKSRFILFFLSLIHIVLSVLGFFEMFLRVVIGTVYVVVVEIAHGLLLDILYVVALIPIPLIRGIDKLNRKKEHHCPHCFRTFAEPIYICPNCNTKHPKLRPGKDGLFITKCWDCEKFIPCSSLSGRSNLDVACPHCGRDLAASNAEEFNILLVGGNKAGKTALLSSFQHEYIRTGNSLRRVAHIEGSPKEQFVKLEEMFNKGETEVSSASKVVSYNFVHKLPDTTVKNLVVYDVPDEVLLDDDFELNPLNFGYTDGIVVLFDPFSEKVIRDQSIKNGTPVLESTYSNDSLEDIINSFIQKLSSIANRASSQMMNIPVAVVITKADAPIVAEKVGPATLKKVYAQNSNWYNGSPQTARNKLCRNYLVDLGLTNALNNLESVFSHVQYFSTSATGGSLPGMRFFPEAVVEPFLWLNNDKSSGLAPVMSVINKACEEKSTNEEDKEQAFSVKYNLALQLLENKRFDEAQQTFSALGSYRDASAKLAEVTEGRYQNAKQLFETGNYRDASAEFKILGNYKDSKNCATEAIYAQAIQCERKGEYQQAIDLLQSLGLYKDAEQHILEARYQIAKGYAKSGDSQKAYQAFNALGNYKDCKSLSQLLLPVLIRKGLKRNIPFGKYSWRVLTVDQHGYALLVTESVIAKQAYHQYRNASVVWGQSHIRGFLNGPFLEGFSKEEKEMIIKTYVKTPNNKVYGTDGGPNSGDKVFLLSDQEAIDYFKNHEDRKAKDSSGNDTWYWLRTLGGNDQFAAYVDIDGSISEGGNSVSNSAGGIRPAFWLELPD